MNSVLVATTRLAYKGVLKRIFFLQDPEKVHLKMTAMGQRLGASKSARSFVSSVFRREYPALKQSLFGVEFKGPLGLAAGFDYEALLTQILPSVGFGFGTVGTLTDRPYQGNPLPRLGRLPKSRSLMVNKGFKNLGVQATLDNLKGKKFEYPVGVSIGKTNTPEIKTQTEGVADVVSAFRKAEASQVPFAYYELNISCPNLVGSVEFYEPGHLEELLGALGDLRLSRPVFVKMPISKTDAEIISIMDVIIRHPFLKAVILGNLQRDRHDPAIVPAEAEKFDRGNWSGIPCQKRSDELIRLVFKKYGSRIKIIGCGGTFSVEDAYRKIKLGASLVQLITGMIFEGPQLIAEINSGLVKLLKKDGFKNISEAVGKDAI
jgi:dihydroorotate dehydrogenase subfamily 2